jgi:hypothetical protein
VRRLDRGDIYPAAGYLAAQGGWTEGLEAEDLADVLRSALSEEYADASDEEMGDALENVLDALSPAEALNFGSALKSASRLASDPTFIQAVRTAAPVAAGLAGTALLGPAGGALGAQLGQLAVSALPAPAAPRSPAAPAGPPPAPPAAAPPVAAVPAPTALAPPPPVVPAPASGRPVSAAPVPGAALTPLPHVPPAAGPESAVAGGSAAAAQALVLTHQPDALLALLAAVLGPHGRKRVSGIPVAQLLALLSQVFGQAAADADELMYLEQQPDAMESVSEGVPADPVGSLYADLLGADNLELAEAAGWEGPD